MRFPVCGATRSGHAFEEFARRFGDFALAGVAASVDVDASGNAARSGSGCAARARARFARRGPRRPFATAAARRRRARRPPGWRPRTLEPPSDLHGDAAYRRELVATLCERAVGTAVARARGAEGT